MVPDYSRDNGTFRPHDLVWVAALADDHPGWVDQALTAGEPCVVRRSPRTLNRLPVGVRGPTKIQRHAGWIDPAAIERRETPESVASQAADWTRPGHAPALRMLGDVAALLDAAGWRWGITGAVGFQIASARKVVHEASDLDLLIRAPQFIARTTAATLYRRLALFPVRCDVQLETPAGGVALADWAGGADRVLVKSDTGPFLAADLWTVGADAQQLAKADR
jgi:phosphoribosyl-dephospho-CoA transferase